MPSENPSFEEAFVRLEELLEKINSGTLTLDELLKLYEEADGLIHFCNQKLTSAEKKVEMLIKNRSGEISLADDGKPGVTPYPPLKTEEEVEPCLAPTPF